MQGSNANGAVVSSQRDGLINGIIEDSVKLSESDLRDFIGYIRCVSLLPSMHSEEGHPEQFSHSPNP